MMTTSGQAQEEQYGNSAEETSFTFPWIQNARKALDPLCAGYIAGIAGIIVGHPLDSMKVLLQTGNAGPCAAAAPTPTHLQSFVGTVSVPASTARTLSSAAQSTSMTFLPLPNSSSKNKRSLRNLYAGVSGPLLTIGIVSSVNFGLYDTFRRALYTYEHGDDTNNRTTSSHDYLHYDSLFNVALSSTAAGSFISFATSPLMVVKTKQQVMLWSMKKAAKDTFVHQGGLRNFYAGFGAHFICDALGRGVYFTTYEYLKRQTRMHNSTHSTSTTTTTTSDTDPVKLISLPERMACASVAGMICWSVIFPFDVIRSKTYAQAALLPSKTVSPTSFQLAVDIFRKGGIRPFFKGFSITIVRAGPVAAVVLPIFDLALDWLSKQNAY